MENRFTIYEGKEPYIFVSYCHRDAETVLAVLESMVLSGYRIWYDGGIPWTEEWAKTIKDRIRSCAVFMAFHSHESALSEHCRLEIHYAMGAQKPVFSSYLEDIALGHGLDELLATSHTERLTRIGVVEPVLALYVVGFLLFCMEGGCQEFYLC